MENQIKHIKGLFYLGDNPEHTYARLEYRIDEDKMNIYHTFVDPSKRGQGLAKILLDEAIKFAKEKNYLIIPTCDYASKVMTNNHEYEDILLKGTLFIGDFKRK